MSDPHGLGCAAALRGARHELGHGAPEGSSWFFFLPILLHNVAHVAFRGPFRVLVGHGRRPWQRRLRSAQTSWADKRLTVAVSVCVCVCVCVCVFCHLSLLLCRCNFLGCKCFGLSQKQSKTHPSLRSQRSKRPRERSRREVARVFKLSWPPPPPPPQHVRSQ